MTNKNSEAIDYHFPYITLTFAFFLIFYYNPAGSTITIKPSHLNSTTTDYLNLNVVTYLILAARISDYVDVTCQIAAQN